MKTFSKKESSLLGWLVIALGIFIYYFVVFPITSSDLTIMEKLIFSFFILIIYLIPNIIYLIIALNLKVKFRVKLLISASFLLISQLFFTIVSSNEVTHGSSSTSSLVFLVIWIPPTIALLLGLVIGYLIERSKLKS